MVVQRPEERLGGQLMSLGCGCPGYLVILYGVGMCCSKTRALGSGFLRVLKISGERTADVVVRRIEDRLRGRLLSPG